MPLARRLASFFSELRRRRVVRAALLYAVVGWVVIEVSSTVAPLLRLPDWTPTLVVVLAALGFPIMLVFAWVYDVTPTGVVVSPSQPTGTPAVEAPIAVAEAPASSRSVAVLPFADMSAAQDQGHFGDGIAEEILNALARLPHLRVAARTSAFAFRDRGEDMRRIGEQLGVAAVLEGSVRVAGSRVRITAQLIEVASGYHLWSERYDREQGDVLAIQDEIAGSIARALDVRIGDARPRTDAVTSDPQAYDAYLRGRSYLAQLHRQKVEQARDMFRAATARDPGFAAAHAAAAEASALLFLYWHSGEQSLMDAEACADRAIALAPDRAYAHTARGFVLSMRKRYDEAVGEFETALQIDPLSYDAHYYHARSSWAAGDMASAERHFKRAAELRPEDFNALAMLESLYSGQRRTGESTTVLRDIVARVQRHLELNPDDARALEKGATALLMLGQEERAAEWVRRADDIAPDDAALWYNVACAHARLGQTDKALATLEKAIDCGFAHRDWVSNDPDWSALAGDARFHALLTRLPA